MERKINQYLEELSGAEPDFIKIVRNSCPDHLKKMQLSVSEAKLIVTLAKFLKPQKILELGTLVGTSTLWLASLLKEKGQIITVEKSYNNYLIAKENLEAFKDRVKILHKPALEALEEFQGEFFDLIFIDAKKSEYVSYWPLVKKIIRKEGLVLIDNSLMFDKGKEIAESIKNFNLLVAEDLDFAATIIPTTSGITYAIKL
jgi:predicted O-methyltransferase YrrM